MAMKQYRVMGVDAYDKTHWRNAQGYWGPIAQAELFTKHEANEIVDDQHRRNLYLDANDRFSASIVGAM